MYLVLGLPGPHPWALYPYPQRRDLADLRSIAIFFPNSRNNYFTLMSVETLISSKILSAVRIRTFVAFTINTDLPTVIQRRTNELNKPRYDTVQDMVLVGRGASWLVTRSIYLEEFESRFYMFYTPCDD